jgi:glycosyltransferase involved in cell wall biosynthesis
MKKILIVAMADSVHTARWIRQFDKDKIEFVLFPSTPHRRIHPLILQHISQRLTSTLKISKWMKLGALPIGIFDLIFNNFFRAKLLAAEINSFQPDFVHVMETQHSGYLTDKALANVKKRPKIVLSIWGSDLLWFQRFTSHKSRIESILKKVDYLITECHRDEEIAKSLGFLGSCIYGVPASGGFSLKEVGGAEVYDAPSLRKIIAIKGYSGFVGLGPMALRALNRIPHLLNGYSIVVFSANWKTRFIAQIVKLRTGLKIEIRMKHSQTPAEMRSLFLKSRIVIGVSESDGLPATIKEAAFFGAFPVQTDTSCAGEWFENGVSILLIPAHSPESLEQALITSLKDDKLVDTAAQINFEIARSRMDSESVRSKISTLYN